MFLAFPDAIDGTTTTSPRRFTATESPSYPPSFHPILPTFEIAPYLASLEAQYFRCWQAAPVPNNYSRIYSDRHACSVSNHHLSYFELEWFDTINCSNKCDSAKGCQAFNIYFERIPTLNLGPKCRTAESTTAIKCVLWGNKLKESYATNRGYMNWEAMSITGETIQ
ncbi:hypothetical protein GQ44DRAFT_58353 [Phaeosphaeriaceae sp. PMI808]|nr:hypothetical protein GQ44DRAFT_58353 [Phaeosphaeriaceae sp. PMI808]